MNQNPSGFISRNPYHYRYKEALLFLSRSEEHRKRAEGYEGREEIEEDSKFNKPESIEEIGISNMYSRSAIIFFFFSLEGLVHLILSHLSNMERVDLVREIVWSRSIVEKFRKLH